LIYFISIVYIIIIVVKLLCRPLLATGGALNRSRRRLLWTRLVNTAVQNIHLQAVFINSR